jgi:hypothetical protein
VREPGSAGALRTAAREGVAATRVEVAAKEFTRFLLGRAPSVGLPDRIE